ncbi:hypothetical protein MKZ25_09940 [Solibacillus sp. FSL W7-1464]|uniref:hypothetical protein n=1 Tax=Solibacillus sp. FSL W7-1464 TaxID=2921706 RepID=UPI0030F727D8
MHQFFARLLIGYLMIILDIQIVIDWLPDIIGFIVIAYAIRNYADSKYGKTAFRLSWLVGILSVFQMPVMEGIFSGLPQELLISYEFIISFANLIFYYYIFGVCFSFVEQTPHMEYTKRVKNWLIGSLWFLMTANYILVHIDWVVLSIIFVIGAIILFISIIRFIVYCYKMMKYGKMIESDEASSSDMNLEPITEPK